MIYIYIWKYCYILEVSKTNNGGHLSNHSEILAMHEASQECVWLRSMTQHIRKSCGLSFIKNKLTVFYEDNVASIAQVKEGCIKGDQTKHISQKFFYTHELQNSGEINVQ